MTFKCQQSTGSKPSRRKDYSSPFVVTHGDIACLTMTVAHPTKASDNPNKGNDKS